MQITKATSLLRTHNAWRRGDDESIQATDPTELGIAIDTVLENNDDLKAASKLLCECRSFIDDIVPGCSAGHDELEALKRRVDLFFLEFDSRMPNPADQRAASAPVHPVVGQSNCPVCNKPIEEGNMSSTGYIDYCKACYNV